jgi:protein SCO1
VSKNHDGGIEMLAGRRFGARGWWWAGAALVVIVAAALWGRARFTAPALEGAVLTPPVRAYDFQLPDQDGRIVSLAGLHGKVVALTFLYAHCPDYCPLIADQINTVHAQLGALGTRVAFVAVSVDPSGDTPEAIRGFLNAHHVTGVLTYLRGTAAQLRPVWAHYFVASDAKDGISASATAAQGVSHTTIVYVIDPEGLVRVFLPANFDPKDLVTDIRLLARTAR